jgi:hypothetical protein
MSKNENGGAYNMYEEEKRCIWLAMGKYEGGGILCKPRHRRDNNTKMGLQEIGGGAWTGLAQDRGKWLALMNPFINLLIPQDDGHFLICTENISFSRRLSSMEYFHTQNVFDEQLDTYNIT